MINADSTIRSLRSNYPLYRHFVAMSLKCVQSCFIHMGQSYSSSILQSLSMFSMMSQSFLPIFKGSFEQIRKQRSIACKMTDSSPIDRDLFFPVPYISLNPFQISLSWQIRELVYGISTFDPSIGRQISVLSQWLRQSFHAWIVLGFICRSLPKTCLQTTYDCPLMMSKSLKSLFLKRVGPFSCSSGFDWISNNSEPMEFILFLWGSFLRCAVRGLFGVTSLEFRKELMPKKLEFDVQLFAYS